jgi:putative PIN family toxin of toxin-antitoxin system
MLVVIDTNELLKMAATYKTSPLFVAWREGRFHLALSKEILKEMVDVTARPRVRRFLSPVRVQNFVSLALSWAKFFEPVTDPDMPHCRDPKDDIVIATAIAAHAQFIVTCDGDLHDQPLADRLRDEYGVWVMWPAEFLKAVQS